MPRIAIVNDMAEIVAIVGSVLTKGDRQFLKQIGATEYTVARLLAFAPDVVVLALHRRTETLDRPLGAFCQDVDGGRMLDLLAQEPAITRVPLILLGFAVRREDVPAELLAPFADAHFLAFPADLQELNPLLSAYVGPAGQT